MAESPGRELRRLRNDLEVGHSEDGKVYVLHPTMGAFPVPKWFTEPIPEEEATGEPQPDQHSDLLARVEALERRMDAQEDRHQVLVDRVVALEPQRRAIPAPAAADGPVQCCEGGPLKRDCADCCTVLGTPAAADGPSAEEVLAFLHRFREEELRHWGRAHGGALPPSVHKIDAAIRLIRAGQEDTRPVLTDEMVVEACHHWKGYIGALGADEVVPMRRALLATGAFREAP